MTRFIIGLTGAFGSGTSFIAKNFFETKGYKLLSLSQCLKDLYKEKNGKTYETRSELQQFGNDIRKENITKLAEIVDEKIDDNSNYIIESIRNPAEVKFFRDKYTEFILIGIFADYDVRWERVKKIYKESKDMFNIDEQKDQGKMEPYYGQKISDCFFEADLILSNNDRIICKGDGYNEANDKYYEMESKINGYLIALNNPAKSSPTLVEASMAAAYTSGRRSKCLKRKVGAVITDKYDKIISSGFNGVPNNLKECSSQYGHCYRDEMRTELGELISKDLELSSSSKSVEAIKKRVKLLELCRAMHGEESAIINLVGKGINMENSTIYVTTYPCNLCANKIVQTGIKKVIYFEPYPVEEAKKTLKDGNVKSEPFEGVTFRAFFKFFQYEP